ncbi:MAG: PilZ domain-containing protein [Nitrospira sp.]
MEQPRNYQRSHYRLPKPVTYPVMFAASGAIGEGTMTNLSVVGCTIECAAPIPYSTNLLLRLFLPDEKDSLPIENAQVRWIGECQIGVEFTKIDRAANLRLHGFVWDRMLERLQTLAQSRSSA